MLVSTGHPALVCLSVLAPPLIICQASRADACLCAVGYYIGALMALPVAIAGFFGPSLFLRVGLYGAALAVLSFPWLLVWGKSYRGLRCIAGVALGTIPPIGLIGWASPLFAAGWLFPGTGFLGIALLLLLLAATVAAATEKRKRGAFLAAVVLLICSQICNIVHGLRLAQAASFAGVVLHDKLNGGALLDYQQTAAMQARVLASGARVTVLPEGAQLNWSEVSEAEWQPTFDDLLAKRRVVLIGATRADEGQRFHNGILIAGAERAWHEQRIPVPVAMWRPFTNSGAPIHPWADGIMTIGGEKTGMLLCYEMAIPWPAILTLGHYPQHLVGMANDWWAASVPSVARWQRTNLEGWARLAGIDSTFAVNLPSEAKP